MTYPQSPGQPYDSLEREFRSPLLGYRSLISADRYGLTGNRNHLRVEYSHSDLSVGEYLDEVLRIAGIDLARNLPYPCGTGRRTNVAILIKEVKRRMSR